MTVSPKEGDFPDVQGTNATIIGLTSNKEYTIIVKALGSDERYGAALQISAITSMFSCRRMMGSKWFHL